MILQNSQPQKKQTFPYYSQYLKQQKQKQLQKLKGIPSKLSVNHQIQELEIHPQYTSSQTLQENGQKSAHLIGKGKNIADRKHMKQNWVKLDSKAYIINGKLLYIENDEDQLLTSVQQEKNKISTDYDLDLQRQKVTQLLKIHKIPLEQYIYGDRQKILQEIGRTNETIKNKKIEKHVSKNMRNEDEVKVITSEWYHKRKDDLFTE